MGTALHPATAQDVPAVRDLVKAAFSKYVERIGKPPAPMLVDYDDLLKTQSLFVLRGGDDGRLVGTIVLEMDKDSKLVHIGNLAVDPAAQGRGFGRALLEHAERVALANNMTTLALYTNVKMHENFGLYAKMGFREVERRTELSYERVYFRKDLP
ncbi:hypothetical protein CDD83_7730 [Cordyceps sp. RAO-2017]|nr:hypothetical protein CDD83_7730 [Cordyceps sp. RAO-2017]